MTQSSRSPEEREPVRTCPVCELNGVGIPALIAAAVDSTSRCSECGSAVRFNWVRGVLSTTAFAVGLAVGLALQSVSIGVVIGIATLALVLLSPLRPDETDPATFRETLRGSRKS